MHRKNIFISSYSPTIKLPQMFLPRMCGLGNLEALLEIWESSFFLFILFWESGVIVRCLSLLWWRFLIIYFWAVNKNRTKGKISCILVSLCQEILDRTRLVLVENGVIKFKEFLSFHYTQFLYIILAVKSKSRLSSYKPSLIILLCY